MRKNNFKSNSRKSSDRNFSKGAGKPASKGGGGGDYNPQRHKSDKLTYPKSWRQVAGTHAIMELINTHPKSVQVVLLQTNFKSSAELTELSGILESKKIKMEQKSEAQLQEICRSHQGAVAFSDLTLEFDYENASWENNGLVVALDGVEDTQNLGAVLRTSWLMGVDGIIIPEDRAVGLTANVHKVASGGAEHVPIHRTNQFSAPFETLKQAGFWVFGLSHKAKKTIYDLQIPEKVIWVLGSEDKGLRGPTEKACDELVCIPQLSPNASYNVSVSAALALGETKRQWSIKK
ncbi:23S rRNA (guanosine(2251)-2'-O)-methyltransferase RlmB [bacterium]|nr:23S rRNA (guanosine(2251)-2'-O)-methyltransferase RlmB [bacterium]